MNKKFFLVVMTFIALALISCNREDPTPDNPVPDNPSNSDFDSYEEIEAYCLENGWSECSLEVPGSYEDGIGDLNNYFVIQYSPNGTLGYPPSAPSYHISYKLFPSFSTLLSTDTPPTDGFISYFTCDNEKFGVCKTHYTDGAHNIRGYSKFYIRRINEKKIKILFKKCDWEYIE